MIGVCVIDYLSASSGRVSGHDDVLISDLTDMAQRQENATANWFRVSASRRKARSEETLSLNRNRQITLPPRSDVNIHRIAHREGEKYCNSPKQFGLADAIQYASQVPNLKGSASGNKQCEAQRSIAQLERRRRDPA